MQHNIRTTPVTHDGDTPGFHVACTGCGWTRECATAEQATWLAGQHRRAMAEAGK